MIAFVLWRQLLYLDEVVEDGPDLLGVCDELVEEEHLGHVVVEAPDLAKAQKLTDHQPAGTEMLVSILT